MHELKGVYDGQALRVALRQSTHTQKQGIQFEQRGCNDGGHRNAELGNCKDDHQVILQDLICHSCCYFVVRGRERAIDEVYLNHR